MSDNKKRKKRKKRSKTAFAVIKFLKLSGASLAFAFGFALIIASVFMFSFRSSEKNEDCTLKIRTQRQTKAYVVKAGDSEIVKSGYFPLTALDGIVGIRAVGDKNGIIISNPSGTETMEITPDLNLISVNGTWMSINSPVLYKDGECYLPIEVIEKYTCLSVSYDEINSVYTVSTAGTEDISFFPKNSVSDSPV